MTTDLPTPVPAPSSATRTRPPVLALTMALATALIGCGDPGSGAAEDAADFAGTVRDSAGIRIVENTDRGLWAADGGWTTEELLTIGEAAGDPNYQFGQIAAVDVLSDGRIAVLDSQAQEVRIYDADGSYEQTFGGPGNGPGELSPQAITMFVGRGDTLVVPDMGNQRIALIPPEGEAASFPLRIEQGVPMGFDMSDSGRLVSQRRLVNFGDPTAEVADEDLVLAQEYDGTIIDTLLTPARGGTFEMTGGGPQITLFAPEPQWTMLADDRIAYASNDAYRISVYGAEGELDRIVTFPHEPQPVTESEQSRITDLVRQMWEENGVPPQSIDQMSSALSFAEHWPAFTRMRGGPYGTLWVQRVRDMDDMTEEELENWNPQLDQGDPRWDVFESDGRYGGVVELPARFTPFALEEDRIYGVFRDDFDVQYVRVYRLDTGMRPADA